MYMDSHCHLDPRVYGGDDAVDAVIERAKRAGVTKMTTIGAGYGLAGSEAAIMVAERHDHVWCTIGLHPHDAKFWEETRARLLELARHPKVVALGEMGLDFYYDKSPRQEQRRVFREQIRIALSMALPITIHDRDSDGETLAILEQEDAFAGSGVLFHCYCGDVAMMERIVELGGFIAIPGIVTFKNAGVMVDVAKAVPEDRILVETDSPFLTPSPHRGSRNEPQYVRFVSDFIADLRTCDRDGFARLTSANACRFYGC